MRVGRLGLRYLRQQAGAAQEEWADDLRRFMIGSLVFTVGLIFALHALIFLHVVAMLWLPGRLQVSTEVVLLSMIGLDTVVALITLARGWAMLRRPFLTKTRAALDEVQSMLVEI